MAQKRKIAEKQNPLSFRIAGDNASGFRWYLVTPDGTLLAQSVQSLPTRQQARKQIAAVVDAVKTNPPVLGAEE